MRAWLVCVVPLGLVGSLSSQGVGGGQSGARALLPRDREIALARCAGPAQVTDSATIHVLAAQGYEAAVRGTTGAACYVSRDWLSSLEPHCFDREGAATILPLAMHRVTLLHQGKTPAEADREIADGIMSGRFRLPQRPVMSYMLSAAQQLVSEDGRAVGAWKPHLMIYYPYLTDADLGYQPGGSEAVSIADAGKPTASIVIVVPSFVQPRLAGTAGR
jgi:hypothetical protein